MNKNKPYLYVFTLTLGLLLTAGLSVFATSIGNNMSVSGTLGVGTTQPGYKLDVQSGYINASSGLCMNGSCKTTWGSADTFWTANGSNAYNNNSGNIGIGTTSPWGLLSVNPNNITSPAFVVGSTTGTSLIVTNGGDVGIGTAQPSTSYKLSIISGTEGGINIRPTGNADNQKSIYIQNDQTGANAYGVYAYIDAASQYPIGGLFTANSPNSTSGYIGYGIIATARANNSGAANQAYGVAGYFKGTASNVRPYNATELNLNKSVSVMIDTDYDDTGAPGNQYSGLGDLIRARLFKNGTATGADLLWLDGSGRLAIGHGVSSLTDPMTRPRLWVAETAASDQFVETAVNTPRGIVDSQHNDGTDDARFYLRKSRGTLTAPTTIQSGDALGTLWFSGYDGTNYLDMASIAVVSEGTVASTRVPTRIAFSTATNASPSVLTERMRIDSSGNVGIGTTSPASLLSLSSNATTTIQLGTAQSTTKGSCIQLYSTSGNAYRMYIGSAGTLITEPGACQ